LKKRGENKAFFQGERKISKKIRGCCQNSMKFVRREWETFSKFLDMWWVIGQRSFFGMMCGVKINH
jgi:hypothetical protein